MAVRPTDSGIADSFLPERRHMSLKTAWLILKQTGSNWLENKAPRLSAALAFFAMLSLSPLLLIATSVAGLFYEDSLARNQLVAQVRGLTGGDGAQVVQQALESTQFTTGKSVWAVIISLVMLLVGATAVFVELQSALDKIWGVTSASRKGGTLKNLLISRGLSLALILILGFLLVVSLIASALLAGFQHYLAEIWPGLGIISSLANMVFSTALLGLLFSLIFRYLPDTKVDANCAWIGGFATVALLTVGKWGIGIYLGNSAVGSAYGAAASLVVFLVWVYYSMLLVLFGAEFTHVLCERKTLASAQRCMQEQAPLPQKDRGGANVNGPIPAFSCRYLPWPRPPFPWLRPS